MRTFAYTATKNVDDDNLKSENAVSIFVSRSSIVSPANPVVELYNETTVTNGLNNLISTG